MKYQFNKIFPLLINRHMTEGFLKNRKTYSSGSREAPSRWVIWNAGNTTSETKLLKLFHCKKKIQCEDQLPQINSLHCPIITS